MFLVKVQEKYIYATGGNTTSPASVIKMLPNGNLLKLREKTRYFSDEINSIIF